MPSCVFRKCTNYESKINKTQGISYHMFPTNEVQLQEWIAVVRKQRSELDWMPSKSSRICSNHFKTTHMYTSKKGRTLLRKEALPLFEEHLNQTFTDSSASLDNNMPELEDILESPRRVALKKRVRVLSLEKQQLQKKNKVLVRQNKRLKKRVVRLALILKFLKSKITFQNT